MCVVSCEADGVPGGHDDGGHTSKRHMWPTSGPIDVDDAEDSWPSYYMHTSVSCKYLQLALHMNLL